jgi:hypothetical protein
MGPKNIFEIALKNRVFKVKKSFFFFDISTQRKKKGSKEIQTIDLHFMSHGLQPFELSFGNFKLHF